MLKHDPKIARILSPVLDHMLAINLLTIVPRRGQKNQWPEFAGDTRQAYGSPKTT